MTTSKEEFKSFVNLVKVLNGVHGLAYTALFMF